MAQLARAQVAQLVTTIIGASGDDLDTLVAIAKCESDYRTTIVHTNRDGSTDTGLWQINSQHRKRHPEWTVSWLKGGNPPGANNAIAARTLYSANRFSDWEASKDCWSKEVKTSRSERDTSLYDVPVVGETAAAAKTAAGILVDASKWLGDPGNWVRIVQVVGGTIVGVAALALVFKDTDIGQAVVAGATKGTVKTK